MLSVLDLVVIGVYLAGVIYLGIRMGGRQESTTSYFLGNRDLPWWAVCFSVVATETSTLTVIGVPAIAFAGSLTFLQLTLGYLLGRIVVSIFLLPRYFAGEFSTAYSFLGDRFGKRAQGFASLTFLVTRLLADGVRLFATAIPIRLIALSAGWDISYFQIIVLIGVFTILYTMIGGIKAVIWMDVIQMTVYVGGACIALAVLLVDAPAGWWESARLAGKTPIVDPLLNEGWVDILTQPYAFITAVAGGAIFSMASHGADQLIVQRLLACKNLKESRWALIGSGLAVMVQFILFLGVGLLLWFYYDGASVAELGLSRADEIFPKFIIEGLPAGVSGIILAGIIAAAMSTLSSSLNALASSTMMDLFEKWNAKKSSEQFRLKQARIFTVVWGVIFIIFASLFEDQNNPVVELGLAIASFTYGGLLGLFVLGLWNRRVGELEAVIAFGLTILCMVLIIFGVWHTEEAGWVFMFNPSDERVASEAMRSIAWPWYTTIGTLLTWIFGSIGALVRR